MQGAGAGRFAFAALILSNLFLAFGPWMVRLADVGPIASGFWRVMLAVPLLLLLVRTGGGSIRPGRGMTAMIVVGGLFFAADLAAWHISILHTKLANATLLANSSSLFFSIYGLIIARMLPRRAQIAALLLACVGGGLLMASSYDLSPRNLLGDLLALLAGAFYTFYLIAIDRARRTLAPMPILALSTLATILPMLALTLAFGEQLWPRDWTPLLLLALGSQVVGQGLLVYAIGHLSPVVVGVAFLTQPLVTAIIGRFAYGETLSPVDAVGAVLICTALVLIRWPAKVESSTETSQFEADRRSG